MATKYFTIQKNDNKKESKDLCCYNKVMNDKTIRQHFLSKSLYKRWCKGNKCKTYNFENKDWLDFDLKNSPNKDPYILKDFYESEEQEINETEDLLSKYEVMLEQTLKKFETKEFKESLTIEITDRELMLFKFYGLIQGARSKFAWEDLMLEEAVEKRGGLYCQIISLKEINNLKLDKSEKLNLRNKVIREFLEYFFISIKVGRFLETDDWTRKIERNSGNIMKKNEGSSIDRADRKDLVYNMYLLTKIDNIKEIINIEYFYFGYSKAGGLCSSDSGMMVKSNEPYDENSEPENSEIMIYLNLTPHIALIFSEGDIENWFEDDMSETINFFKNKIMENSFLDIELKTKLQYDKKRFKPDYSLLQKSNSFTLGTDNNLIIIEEFFASELNLQYFVFSNSYIIYPDTEDFKQILNSSIDAIKFLKKEEYKDSLEGPMSETNNKKNKSKKRRKVSINDLTDNDRQIYQDIMEEVLEDHGVPKNHVMEKFRERKKETED